MNLFVNTVHENLDGTSFINRCIEAYRVFTTASRAIPDSIPAF